MRAQNFSFYLPDWRIRYGTDLQYLFVTFRESYADARSACVSYSGQLASIADVKEDEFLVFLVQMAAR